MKALILAAVAALSTQLSTGGDTVLPDRQVTSTAPCRDARAVAQEIAVAGGEEAVRIPSASGTFVVVAIGEEVFVLLLREGYACMMGHGKPNFPNDDGEKPVSTRRVNPTV